MSYRPTSILRLGLIALTLFAGSSGVTQACAIPAPAPESGTQAIFALEKLGPAAPEREDSPLRPNKACKYRVRMASGAIADRVDEESGHSSGPWTNFTEPVLIESALPEEHASSSVPARASPRLQLTLQLGQAP